MKHDSTGRYWRFDPCDECDDPECCEGNSVDVTAYVRSLEIIAVQAREWRDEQPRTGMLRYGFEVDLRAAVNKHEEAWQHATSATQDSDMDDLPKSESSESKNVITSVTQDTNADSDRLTGRDA